MLKSCLLTGTHKYISIYISGSAVVKNPPANAGDTKDMGSIPGLGRSSGGGNEYPLQYPCLENFMDRGAWWATFHGVSKSQTQLSTRHNVINVYSCIGEGNGTPLQCSCLENSRDGGAWWAAVYGVAQSGMTEAT